MRRIKICVQMPTHWSWVMGGAEYQVSLLMQRLVHDDKFEIIFLTRRADLSFSPVGYSIKKFNINRYLSKYSNAFDAKSLMSRLVEIQPDIIYQRVGCAYTGVCAKYAKEHNIPMVWHISHDMDVDPKINHKKKIFGVIEKKFLEYGIRHSTKIIAQTKKQASFLNKYYGRDIDWVIKNFHPIPESPVNKKEGPLRIVWIANFKPIKQPELFVRLAKELENTIDAKFIMIGKIYIKEYDKLRKTIDSISNLEYLSEQPQDKVNEVLSSAHLLVNTSKLEGFSNTFIQAWMREVPVLTLTVDPDYVITKNEIGICSGSYKKLKDIIIDLADSPEKITQMGKKAKDYAYQNHSMANVERIVEILTSLTSTN